MRDRIKRMSMRKRMILSFAIPIITLQIIMFCISYPLAIKRYREQLRYSSEQSMNQAVSFLESYMKNMAYLAEMVENSWEIQEILSSDEFDGEEPYDDQYYDFYRLNKQFGAYEFMNSMYRFQLYIPDTLIYSSNEYYFSPDSTLEKRDDYPKMIENLNRGKDYFSVGFERKSLANQDKEEMLTLYHRIGSQIKVMENIGICSISISADRFREVMENANITENSLVYLLDSGGEKVVSSDPVHYVELDQEKLPQNGQELLFDGVNIGGEKYYVNRYDVGPGGWQMVALIPIREYDGMYQGMAAQLVFLSIIVVIAVAAASYALSGYYVGRLTKLRGEMQRLQGGNLNVQLPLNQQEDEIEEVYRNFNFMVDEVRRLMQEQYQLGKNVKVAELRALQAQINPHFLYNTLDLINWIAMDYGAGDIENIAWNLARYYRLSLNHGKSVISIEEEIEHTQVYVNIENYHFDNAISMCCRIPEELKKLACLNIILQPFVENAIVHGIAENSSISRCAIQISAERDGDDILFRIQDDGPGMTKQQMEDAVSMDMRLLEKGYGIKNINFRIKLCFGEKYGVRYESVLGDGTTAYIRIPVMTIAEAEEKVM